MEKRGIIVAPKINVVRNTFDNAESHIIDIKEKIIHNVLINDGSHTLDVKGLVIDQFSLRSYLLYWDIIDWPKAPEGSDVCNRVNPPDIDFLISTGNLIRTPINLDGPLSLEPEIDKIMKEVYATRKPFFRSPLLDHLIFKDKVNKLLLRKDGIWALGYSNQSDADDSNEIASKETAVEIELYKSLPVPAGDVALDDILHFKEKRKEEFLRFRGLMDDLYLNVVNSNDIPRAKTRAIELVQQSIADLHKIMNESKIKRILSTLKIQLKISKNLPKGAFIGGLASILIGFPIELGAIIGATTSSINFSINLLPGPQNIPPHLKDYAYLFYIGKEIIGV